MQFYVKHQVISKAMKYTNRTLFLTSRSTPMGLKIIQLTLSLPLGRVATFATSRLLKVIGLRATTAAQCVRLIATLSKR